MFVFCMVSPKHTPCHSETVYRRIPKSLASVVGYTPYRIGNTRYTIYVSNVPGIFRSFREISAGWFHDSRRAPQVTAFRDGLLKQFQRLSIFSGRSWFFVGRRWKDHGNDGFVYTYIYNYISIYNGISSCQ